MIVEGHRREERRRKEVGCQSEAAERRDAAVQVDLLTQQLSWRHSGETQGHVIYHRAL